MSSTSPSFAFRPGKKINREFIRVLGQMADHARAPARPADVSESIHETRVLIKRFRALLWFANQTLPAIALKQAKSRLQQASHLLAPQRDLAVMRDTWSKLAENAWKRRDRKTLARISHASSSQAVDEKCERLLRQALDILLGTLTRVTQSAKTCTQWPTFSNRQTKALQAAKKAGKKALHGGNAVQFHNWRKKMKRLFHQLQLTHAAPGHRMARMIERVDKLQGELGDYHDSVVAQDHLRKNPPAPMSKALVNRSIKLLEKRKKRLREKTRKLAKRIRLK